MGEPTTRDRYLFGQLGGSQQSPSKQWASIFDGAPCRAECRLLDDIVHLSGRNPKFGRPVLIECNVSRAMPSSQTSSPSSASERRAKGLQGVVTECVRLSASDREGVRDAARRAPVRSTRRDHVGSRAMANSRIVVVKQRDQSLVLAQRHPGQPPHATIGRARDAKTCARDCRVVGPRIVLERIEQPGQFIEQSLVGVLQLTPPVEGLGERSAFFIEIDASENGLSAGREGGEVFRDPIRRDLAVGVGGQDHAVAFARFHKPRLGKVHHRATGVARVCGGRRQSIFDDADVERQTCAELSGEARTAIGAIVGEYDNANKRRRNRVPQPVALPGKSAQAGRQSLFFIPDGYGDNETRSSGRGRDEH